MCQLSPVPFHGDTIFCIEHHNQPYTPAKPIVENLGLAWQAQARKLTENKGRWGVIIMVIPSESGEQQTLCLPVRKLPAYLASINPKKVRPELRAKIELYQAESDDALWNYWMKGRAERSAQSSDAPLTPDQQCTLRALVKARVESLPLDARSKGIYPQIWGRFNNHFRIARYSQLPQSLMSAAIEYLAKMEITQRAVDNPEPKALPASYPLLAEAGASCMAEILNLRGSLFKASVDLKAVMQMGLSHGNSQNLGEVQRAFSQSLGQSVDAFFMSINHNMIAIEHMFRAFMEAEKLIHG